MGATCKVTGPTGFLCGNTLPCPHHPRGDVAPAVGDVHCWNPKRWCFGANWACSCRCVRCGPAPARADDEASDDAVCDRCGRDPGVASDGRTPYCHVCRHECTFTRGEIAQARADDEAARGEKGKGKG